MLLSTNSWHYKLVAGKVFGYFNPIFKMHDVSNSLCWYFWQTLIGLFYRIFFVYIVHTPLLLFVVLVLNPPPPEGVVLTLYLGIGALLGAALLVIGCSLLIFYSIYCLRELKTKIFKQNKKLDKQPNILVEYIKTKKDKVCPMIEFKVEK